MSGLVSAPLARLLTGLMVVTLTVPALTWEDELPRDQLLLSQVKRRMKQNLARIPSYTCLETITRGQHASERMVIAVPGKSVPFRRMDVVRLEIAEIGLEELFARAGEHTFEKRELRELVKGGLMGNGLFSIFAHNVFMSNIAQYQFRGDHVVGGRTLLQFDFRVPQFLSGYSFSTNRGQATLGYHGSFWADPKSFDVTRLDISADDIPPDLGILASNDRVDYARVLIGSSYALLPQSAEMTVRQDDGGESRNAISFTHCREYGVQTVLKFDNLSESEETTAGGGTNYVDLPSGLQLTLRLDTAIDADSTQIGDLLTATVEVDVKHKGKVVIPKDAVITGRLRQLEKHKEGWPYVLAGLEFTSIEFEGKQSRFFAEMEKIILPPGSGAVKRLQSRELPGVGMVSAMGNHLVLPKGTRMIWKTISYDQASQIDR